MKSTPARIKFKAHLGQANHFLVTSLVGLHTLEGSDVTVAPEVLRTSWNPKSKSDSIIRSRNFVMQSFLGWAVDSIDMYIRLLERKPSCLQNERLLKELGNKKNSRSASNRTRLVASHFNLSAHLVALVDVLITWRNNIFHEANDNSVQETTRNELRRHAGSISDEYRGLDVKGLDIKANNGGSLTFKETASLINAAHHFVEELDSLVITAMNIEQYCAEAVQHALDEREQKSGFAVKYLGLGLARRERFVRTWLKNNHGLAELSPQELAPSCKLVRSVVEADR